MPPPPLSSLSSPSSSLPSLHSLNLTTTTTYHENSLSISTSDVRLTSSTSTLNSPFSSSLHLLTKKEKEEEETLEKKDEKMSGCPFPVSSSSSFPNVSFHNERSSSFPSASSSSSSSSSPSTLSTLSSSRLSLWSFLTNATHTFALTTLDTCQAALHHVWYGPPHTSWNLLTTLTRAALRRVMLCNPPHASHSFPLLQSFMQFTYPVSTRYQFYPVWFEIESADVKDPCVHAWHQLHMTTVLGQSKGHRISGEFVTLATPPWKGSSSSHAAFIRPLDEFVLLKDQLHHLSHPSQALTDPGSVPSQWMASRTLILYVHGGCVHF
ncbi:hypothetical protein HMI54_015572 [Coelomomyces lativittatus]|nr:hypothetical protein HMI54_015572 [Coelomomyces lativittatus]